MTDKLDLLMGANAIADFIGLNRKQVYRLIYSGELPTFKISNQVAARKRTLEAWLTSKEAKADIEPQMIIVGQGL